MGEHTTHVEYMELLSTTNAKTGNFVRQLLVTDTVIYEIVAVSPSGKTVTLRTTKQAVENGKPVVRSETNPNGSPYPMSYIMQEADPLGRVFTSRVNSLGQFGPFQGKPLYNIEVPERRVDMSF
jgi:hypothetical protein